MTMTTKTNNVPRPVIDAYELTADERKQFDYLDWPAIEAGNDSASFFRYRGELYDLGDCERVASDYNELGKWDGFYGESYFSAVAFRYVDNFESVVVAYCHW